MTGTHEEIRRLRTSGVYVILNTATGRRYYGASKNIYQRWNVHRCDLRHGRHANHELQADYDQYGESVLEYSVHCECAPCESVEIESALICDDPDCYNILKNVVRDHGKRIPFATVVEIDRLLKQGLRHSQIVRQCGVSYEAVSNICDRVSPNVTRALETYAA